MPGPIINRSLIDNAFQAILGLAPDGTPRQVQTDDSGNISIGGTNVVLVQTMLQKSIADVLAQIYIETKLANRIQIIAQGLTVDDEDSMRRDVAAESEDAV